MINLDAYSNKGFEGIAVDQLNQTIYAVREKNPMKLIQLRGFIEPKNIINIEMPEKIKVSNLFLEDLSGLHFDSHSKHLLILSDESKMLAEIDLEGNKVSYMDLEKGFNNLSQSIPQAEGVTLDDNGHLYIVSEPNLIYRFSKE